MFTPNRIYVIFIVFMVMSCVSQSFRLHTEESLTAVRGGNISLPCYFSVPAHAVYWYKHNFTGAPDVGASLVARDYQGITDPVPGFERFSITKDYSLIIRNITVHDETTYSSLVVPIALADKRGYTELSVVALAEPREPIIESCNVTAPGRCIYVIDENSPDDIILSCAVYHVRPPPGLTWVRNDGRVPKHEIQHMQEKDGLFNISSQIQVTKADFDKQYTCEANGDAVKGTSSMKITIIEGDFTTVSHDRGISGGLITSIVIIVILLILLVSCLIYYKKCGVPGPLGAVKIQKPAPLGDIESQPLTDQKELTAIKLSQKIEALENVRKEDQASFEEEKREIESKWQKILHGQVEKLKTQELAMTTLSQKIESLENERKEDRALFEKEKLEIESNWQKIINDQVEMLYTQGGETIDCHTWKILIRSFDGGMFPLLVNPNMTVDNLKTKISAKIGVHSSPIYIQCNGRKLSHVSGQCNLKTAGINNLSTINVN
ncbi:uncharacterized protein LOC129267453 isoform X2 [Lytechinus pictus]|uniref:uncharacterized protein LOC129267453 isoform X2 n=1 Tax=Lytechinus pictus TaxID=7653 RepID=UPI0030B9E5F7